MAPRILTGVIGVLLVLLVAWWIFENRMSGDNLESTPQVSQSERTSPSPSSSGQDDANELTGGSAADTLPVAIVDTSRTTAGAETGGPTATQSDQGGEIADIRDADRPVEPPVDPADTGGRSGGEVLIGSEDIIVMDDLERNWQGYYVIHISSFRESIKARDEVKFLLTHEFPAFIVFLDLGAKGKWYRVYVGPIRTREETRELKKSLDDLPRVRFTRITKVAG